MNYTEKLNEWVGKQKETGKLVDLKFFPAGDPDSSSERMAKAAYETLTGVRKRTPLDISNL